MKVVFDRSRLSFNTSKAILICRIGVKYQYTIQAVCGYAYMFFGKDRGVRLLEHVR